MPDKRKKRNVELEEIPYRGETESKLGDTIAKFQEYLGSRRGYTPTEYTPPESPVQGYKIYPSSEIVAPYGRAPDTGEYRLLLEDPKTGRSEWLSIVQWLEAKPSSATKVLALTPEQLNNPYSIAGNLEAQYGPAWMEAVRWARRKRKTFVATPAERTREGSRPTGHIATEAERKAQREESQAAYEALWKAKEKEQEEPVWR